MKKLLSFLVVLVLSTTMFGISFAKDVLRYGEQYSITSDYLINLYYPLLAKQNIMSQQTMI